MKYLDIYFYRDILYDMISWFLEKRQLKKDKTKAVEILKTFKYQHKAEGLDFITAKVHKIITVELNGKPYSSLWYSNNLDRIVDSVQSGKYDELFRKNITHIS